MVVFTSICANYLHKARVLARSVKKYIPDAVFIVCMTERGLTDSMRDDAFDSVVLSKICGRAILTPTYSSTPL